jgi:hypothetical protein
LILAIRQTDYRGTDSNGCPVAVKFDRRAYLDQLVHDVEREFQGFQSAALSNTFPTTELRHLSFIDAGRTTRL